MRHLRLAHTLAHEVDAAGKEEGAQARGVGATLAQVLWGGTRDARSRETLAGKPQIAWQQEPKRRHKGRSSAPVSQMHGRGLAGLQQGARQLDGRQAGVVVCKHLVHLQQGSRHVWIAQVCPDALFGMKVGGVKGDRW